MNTYPSQEALDSDILSVVPASIRHLATEVHTLRFQLQEDDTADVILLVSGPAVRLGVGNDVYLVEYDPGHRPVPPWTLTRGGRVDAQVQELPTAYRYARRTHEGGTL